MVTNSKNHNNDNNQFNRTKYRNKKSLYDYNTTDPHDFTPSPIQVRSSLII